MEARTDKQSSQATGASKLLVDMDTLQEMASVQVIREGVEYFKEHRVMKLDWDDDGLWAKVEGSRPDEPYHVEVEADGDDLLLVGCECGHEGEAFCKHAVAALLDFGARQPTSDIEVKNAADRAIEARMKRGRTQVVVEHVSGEPWFGTWAARSVSSSGITARTYKVQIRCLDGRMNHCTCPDFAANRLGTCKHIEAVVHKLRRKYRRNKKLLARKEPPCPFVYLAWDIEDAPRIRLYRPSKVPRGLSRILNRYFGRDGSFGAALPEGFFELQDRVYGRKDILIGPDAIEHVRRLSEERAQAAKSAKIRKQIMRSGGRLDGVHAHLYPYQVEGVAFLASTGRGLLADDMGLGKTLQAIAASEWLMQEQGARRVLVVCPASLKHQWAREIERFTDRSAEVVGGRPRSRQVQYRRKAPFTIVNYELVRRDVHAINEELAPDILILDEAQRIKNWRTKTATVIKMIETTHAFVLTGTPLENRLEDLYSVMQVVDERILGPLWQYLIHFHVTDHKGKVVGYRNLAELRRRLAPVMLRRDRRLVRDQLPNRIESRMDVPLSQKQRQWHDGAISAAAKYANILKKRPLTPSEEHRLLAALQQARMACDAAGLVDKETKGSAKLDELKELLEQICLTQGRKVVVFSEWERMTAMAEREARKLGIKSVRLHGGVPTNKRGKLLDRFRNDDETLVFFSTDAGGVGLNLQAADVLINLDMPWNPAVLDQRIGRVHRLGQKEPVQVIMMVAEDSYEEKVLATLTAKKDLFQNVVEEEATEDVVGISRRKLQLLTDTLSQEPEDQPAPADEAAAPTPPAPAAETTSNGEASQAGADRARDGSGIYEPTDEDAKRAVILLQSHLGERLERVLATSTGLIAVVDRVDDEVCALAESASNGLTVAAIDTRSLASLNRLGAASPLRTSTPIPLSSDDPEPPQNPLAALPQRKIRAAEVLLREGCHAEGLSLLTEAMLAAAAVRAGQNELPAAQEGAVWLYSECVPRGYLAPEDASAITRAQALAASPQVPAELVEEVLADAHRIAAAHVE
jgi:superfamily II DNA or RNA helicase